MTDMVSTELISADRVAEVEAFVFRTLAERFDVPECDLTPTAGLKDLGLDSLGGVELSLDLKKEYGVHFLAGDIGVELSVADVIALVCAKLAELPALTS